MKEALRTITSELSGNKFADNPVTVGINPNGPLILHISLFKCFGETLGTDLMRASTHPSSRCHPLLNASRIRLVIPLRDLREITKLAGDNGENSWSTFIKRLANSKVLLEIKLLKELISTPSCSVIIR